MTRLTIGYCEWLRRHAISLQVEAMLVVGVILETVLVICILLLPQPTVEDMLATEHMLACVEAVGGLIPEECPPGSVIVTNDWRCDEEVIEVQRDASGVYLVSGLKNGPRERHLLSTSRSDTVVGRYQAELERIKTSAVRPRTIAEIVKELKEAS